MRSGKVRSFSCQRTSSQKSSCPLKKCVWTAFPVGSHLDNFSNYVIDICMKAPNALDSKILRKVPCRRSFINFECFWLTFIRSVPHSPAFLCFVLSLRNFHGSVVELQVKYQIKRTWSLPLPSYGLTSLVSGQLMNGLASIIVPTFAYRAGPKFQRVFEIALMTTSGRALITTCFWIWWNNSYLQLNRLTFSLARPSPLLGLRP